jgi:putative transposase
VIEAEKATYRSSGCASCWECHARATTNGAHSATVDRPRPPGAAPRSTPRSPSSTRPLTAFTAPRILADLRADGERVSRKTVAASLRRQGLAGICPRRFAPATTVIDLDAAVPKDLVRRHFDTGVLNRVWTSDITYLGTAWRELAVLMCGA